jgi:hypothetical protein
MTTVWIFVLIAIAAIGLLLGLALRGRREKADIAQAIQTMRSIDMEAFGNLVDPHEEAFLRQNLPPRKFREIRRERARAAMRYVWCAGQAASQFASVGEAARHSSDPAIAAAGAQIAESAMRLRLDAVGTMFRLATSAYLPGVEVISLPSFVSQYERTADTILRLGRLERGQAA